MTKYTFQDKTYFYEVFETSSKTHFIMLAQKEIPFDGLFKVYFLHKYSIKFAMEDFCKYENLVAQKKENSAVY